MNSSLINTGYRCNVSECGSVLVLDGNQTKNRPVCEAEDAGYVEYDRVEGKVKTWCMNTPKQQSLYCI